MHEPRSPLIRWVLRGAAASLALAAVARLGGEPPQPRAAPIQLSSMQDRIAVARPLPGMQPGEVSNVMNIREPLRYGQSVWKEAGVPAGPITVRVDRDRQILSVFRAGHEIGTTVILYGAPEKPTPAGRYPVRGKKPLHISNRYGAEMPYTLWLTDDGVAIHASNVLRGAATHGCIGVPMDFARRLYDLVQPGVPVVIA